MKILLLGFGHVGKAFASLLASSRYIDAHVVGIITRRHGSVINARGISLEDAIAAFTIHQQFNPASHGWSSLGAQAAVNSLDYDVLVELTTLSIEHDGEPAASHIRGALRRKKHVICANKGPIAFAYRQLRDLAASSGSLLLFESTVMDGAPVFSLARSSLLGCKVKAISGILNSTSNFVLSQMEQGHALEEALLQAQREGFAEADPGHDLEGWDAAAKICVLWNVLAGGDLTPRDVERHGITHAHADNIQDAHSRSGRLKPVARAWRESERDHAVVSLEEVSLEDPFATVSGTGSVLRIETDCMTPILIMQEGPTIKDTAYGLLNDLLTIASS